MFGVVSNSLKSPLRIARVGTRRVLLCSSRRFDHSCDHVKNNLLRSLLKPGNKIGPFRLYPNWLNLKGATKFDVVLRLRDHEFASIAPLRKYSYAEPWNWRVPLLVTTRIWPPDERPYSAPYEAVSTCTSEVWSRSAVPIDVPFERVRTATAPSYVIRLSCVREPLMFRPPVVRSKLKL